MKIVRLVNNVVIEIIPESARPVADWYGEAFASQCVEAPDEVEQHWGYIDGEWIRPEDMPKPEPPKTDMDLMAEAMKGEVTL